MENKIVQFHKQLYPNLINSYILGKIIGMLLRSRHHTFLTPNKETTRLQKYERMYPVPATP